MEALRLSFRAPREAVSRRSRRRRGESGGSSGGTPSPCGSAQAAAAAEEATETMPALHPARLWALLALWLCRAAPARGEYRARGCCPRTPARAPPPPPGAATWGDRPPHTHTLWSHSVREGRARPWARIEATRFLRVWTAWGPRSAPLAPRSPPPPAPLGPWPHARLLGRRKAGQRGSETPFLGHWSSRSLGRLALLVPRFLGLKGEPRAGCVRQTLRWPRTAEALSEGMPGPGVWGSGGRASQPNGVHLPSQK